jgi:hypothetical protein
LAATLPYVVSAALSVWPVAAGVLARAPASPTPWDLVLRAAGVAVSAAVLMTGALVWVSGSPRWAGVVVGLALVASTEYALVVDAWRLPTGILHLPVFIAIIGLFALALRKRPRLCDRAFTGAVLVASVSVIASLVAVAVARRYSDLPLVLPRQGLSTLSASPPARRLPDIYHLVLDGFGRPDVLRDRYGLDLGRVIGELTHRGFDVDSHRGTANYAQTYLSLASMLNGTYLDEIGASFEGSGSRLPVRAWLYHAEALTMLKALGYTIHLVGSEFDATFANPLADKCDCPRPGLGEFETTVIRNTVFGASGLAGLDYRPHRRFIERQLQSLEALPGPGPRPRLVLAHLMSPHPPFIFDRTGRAVSPSRPFSFDDGTLFRGTADEYREGYRAQAEFLASRAIALVDGWRRSSGTEAIIIVHGDHGPRRLFDAYDARRTDAGEVIPVLLAIHWGTTTGDHVTSLVNVYRELLRRFGLPVAQLEDRAYMSDFVRPYRFLRVHPSTLRVESAP